MTTASKVCLMWGAESTYVELAPPRVPPIRARKWWLKAASPKLCTPNSTPVLGNKHLHSCKSPDAKLCTMCSGWYGRQVAQAMTRPSGNVEHGCEKCMMKGDVCSRYLMVTSVSRHSWHACPVHMHTCKQAPQSWPLSKKQNPHVCSSRLTLLAVA